MFTKTNACNLLIAQGMAFFLLTGCVREVIVEKALYLYPFRDQCRLYLYPVSCWLSAINLPCLTS